MDVTVSETLYLAADLIEQHGWTQGSSGWRESGPYCLLGGLGAAMGTRTIAGVFAMWETAADPAAVAVADYLGVWLGGEGEGVYRWNDVEGRTASEVVGVLRAAAVVEAARESQPSVAVA